WAVDIRLCHCCAARAVPGRDGTGVAGHLRGECERDTQSNAVRSCLCVARGRMTRRQMFLRMLVRAAVVRPGRVATALVAVAVAATAATAMLNLYADAEAKLQREF